MFEVALQGQKDWLPLVLKRYAKLKQDFEIVKTIHITSIRKGLHFQPFPPITNIALLNLNCKNNAKVVVLYSVVFRRPKLNTAKTSSPSCNYEICEVLGI